MNCTRPSFYKTNALNQISAPGNVLISSGDEEVLVFANFEFESVHARSDEEIVISVNVSHDLKEKVRSFQLKSSFKTKYLKLSKVSGGEDLTGMNISLKNGVIGCPATGQPYRQLCSI